MSVDRELTFYASPKRTRAVVSKHTLADSVDSILMLEKGHLPVYYFPPDDVRLDLLDQSDRRTHCPIKGDATYWNLNAGDRPVEAVKNADGASIRRFDAAARRDHLRSLAFVRADLENVIDDGDGRAEQPIFAAIDTTAAHRDAWSVS